MEEILYVENELILSQLEIELSKQNIEYFIKKADASIFPDIFNNEYYAILFSNINNKENIIEIYKYLKNDNIIEGESSKNNYESNSEKYCSNCGFKNINFVEMCENCGGLIFVDNKTTIKNKPSIFVSILSFFLPLIGLIIASFCENPDERRRYRNCAIIGFLLFLIFSLINRCIIEDRNKKTMDQLIENILKREKE